MYNIIIIMCLCKVWPCTHTCSWEIPWDCPTSHYEIRNLLYKLFKESSKFVISHDIEPITFS